MEKCFKNPVPGRILKGRLLLFLALVVFAGALGCAQVNHLREAQDAFNQAAQAENALRFSPLLGSETAGLSAAARTGYASVLVSLDRLGLQEVSRLKQDGLWGNVLTLRALARWRLGLYAAAKGDATQALQLPAGQLHPRDRTLMKALPGLIRIDQVHHVISLREMNGGEKMTRSDFDADLEAPLLKAMTILDGARRLVAQDDPVQVYLIQAQLAAYRNLKLAYRKFSPGGKDTVPSALKGAAQGRLQDLSDVLLALLGPSEERSSLVLYWHRLTGLEAPQNECKRREICGG